MSMRKPVVLSLLILATASVSANAAEQNAATAFVHDATLIANKRGWDVEDTITMIQDQRTFRALAAHVKDEYPNDFSSGVNIPSPGGTGTLYFKGTMPSEVSTFIAQSGLTVSTVTGTGKTLTEWRAQADDITDWLDTANYDNFAVAFDDVDTIEVIIGGGASLPTLPTSLQGDVVMTGTAGTLYKPGCSSA